MRAGTENEARCSTEADGSPRERRDPASQRLSGDTQTQALSCLNRLNG